MDLDESTSSSSADASGAPHGLPARPQMRDYCGGCACEVLGVVHSARGRTYVATRPRVAVREAWGLRAEWEAAG